METLHIIEKIALDSSTLIELDSISNTDSLVNLNIHVELTLEFVLKNIETAKATLIGQMFADTTTGRPILLDIVFANKQSDWEELPELYFEQYDIAVGSTIKIPHTFKIAFVKDNTFTIHAIFIYENERKQFFYTYYHSLWKINENDLIQQMNIERDSSNLNQTNSEIDLLVMIAGNNASNPYTKQEKSKVMSFFNSLGKKKVH